jgi:phosphoglycolate phosphatase
MVGRTPEVADAMLDFYHLTDLRNGREINRYQLVARWRRRCEDMGDETYQLFVFDFDGTLADSSECVVASFAGALERNRLPPVDPELIVHHMGRSLPEVFRELTGRVHDEIIQQLVADYREIYRTLLPEKTYAVPGIAEALHHLTGADAVCTVATSKKTEFAVVSARHLGIDAHFTLYIGDDLVTNKKPHPEMLERTLAETGIPPVAAVMIGDATTDIDMGNALGVDTIAVTWGAHPVDRLRAAGPTHIIDSAAQLQQFAPHSFRDQG